MQSMRKRKLVAFIVACVGGVFTFSCKTLPGSVPAEQLLTPNEAIKAEPHSAGFPSNAAVEAMREAFFGRAPEKGEVFRIFITSEGYIRKQLSHLDTVSVKEDLGGDQAIADEFRKFDMVNSLQEGQIHIELYPSTGKFYRVRQSKPSIMKETDKILSDDMTRWQFVFAKNEIEPRDFKVSYQVLLRKRITREQALKILSDQNKKK